MKKNKLSFLLYLSALMMSLPACALKPSEVPSIPSSSETSSEPSSEVSSSEEIVKHIVTFDTQGGTYVEPQEVLHGEKITKPTNPTKIGSEFVCWEYLGEPWEFHSYVVTEDMTLTAVWGIVEYTAIFINHDGTELYRTLVKKGETAIYVGDIPTRANEGDTQFTFNCWEEISNDGETIIFQAKYDGYTAGLIIEGDSVHQYTGSSDVVYIPSFWNGVTITTINHPAFQYTSVREVYLPDSIISIGEATFSACSSLTSINIPDSVTSIGDYAFDSCYSLTSIIIPDSVTSIGYFAFVCCSSLAIFFEAEFRHWSYAWNYSNCPVYWGCNENNLFFSNEHSLIFYIQDNEAIVAGEIGKPTSINIPSMINGYPVTSIPFKTFYECLSLTSIIIPDSVTSIGYFALSGCRSLTSVTLGNNVTLIDDNAFTSCDSLTSIVIPDSVTSIGSYAFSQCYSLTSINIPDSVTSIGSWAFSQCYSLTSIIIPDSITSIGYFALSGCRSLTIFCEAESRPSGWDTDWNFGNRPVYWAGEWEYDADGNPIPIV